MPVYFWKHIGTCSAYVETLSQGVQFEELTREGQAKTLPSAQSRYYTAILAGTLSARPLPRLIYRTILNDSFSGFMNFIFKKLKLWQAVEALRVVDVEDSTFSRQSAHRCR
jgi:hypothetical protein